MFKNYEMLGRTFSRDYSSQSKVLPYIICILCFLNLKLTIINFLE